MTPFVDMKFEILPKVLVETFFISTPVGDSAVAKRVYRNCPIFLYHRVTWVDLVKLSMLGFDVILDMDWLNACYASIVIGPRWLYFNSQMSLS